MAGLGTVLCALVVLAADKAAEGAYQSATFPGCQNEHREIQGDRYNNVSFIIIKNCDVNTFKNISQYVLPIVQTIYYENNDIEGKDMTGLFQNWPSALNLKIQKTETKGAPSTLLQGLPKLQHLSLEHCSLKEIPEFVLKVTSLMVVVLNDNFISTLADPEMFSSLGELALLSIERNLIEYIHADTFKPLVNIKTIVLIRNRIQILNENLFQNLKTLKDVHLSYNQIQYLPPNMFKGCTNLEILSLNNNRLTNLPANFFVRLNSVKFVTLFANPWQCACLREEMMAAKKAGIELKQIPDPYKTTNLWCCRHEYDGRVPECVLLANTTRCHRNDEYLQLYDSSIQSKSQF